MIKIYHSSANKAEIDEPHIDLTSMLDVVFIILIFTVLMVGGSTQLFELQVQLPQVPAASNILRQQEVELLEITAEGKIIFIGKSHDKLATLQKEILAVKNLKQVKIACDERAPVSILLALLQLLTTIDINTTEILLKKY